MKRQADEKQESDDDRQQQAVIAALLSNFQLKDAVRDINEITHAFRFHPLRFLQLLRTSKEMQRAVEIAQRESGAHLLWYKFCLYAFPNFVIALSARDYNFLDEPYTPGLERKYGSWANIKVDNRVSRWPMQNVAVLFDMPQSMWVNTQMLQHRLASDDIDMAFFSRWRGRLDRSFYTPETRKTCLENAQFARGLAALFTRLMPFGMPPAEYCFASHVAAHKLAAQAVYTLIEWSEIDEQWNIMLRPIRVLLVTHVEKLTVYARAEVDSIASDGAVLQYCTYTDFELWVRTRASFPRKALQCRGEGPLDDNEASSRWKNVERPTELTLTDKTAKATPLYVLAEFFTEWIDDIAQLMGDKDYHGSLEALRDLKANVESLREKCVAALVRYTRTEVVEVPVVEGNEISSVVVPGEDWQQQQRATDLELYGDHDPLYWDVLLADVWRRERPLWVDSLSEEARQALAANDQHSTQYYDSPEAWKQALTQLLTVARHEMTDQEYNGLRSRLQCAHCTSLEPRIAQPSAPFRAYCHTGCQRSDVEARNSTPL